VGGTAQAKPGMEYPKACKYLESRAWYTKWRIMCAAYKMEHMFFVNC
jgi:hypothetical protein